MDTEKRILLILLALAVIVILAVLMIQLGNQREETFIVSVETNLNEDETVTLVYSENICLIEYDNLNSWNVRRIPVDIRCYRQICDVINTSRLLTWANNPKKTETSAFEYYIEIITSDNKHYHISTRQKLPKEAEDVFTAIRLCLCDYAAITKTKSE